MLALGSARYLELEEGLAVYQELQLKESRYKMNGYALLAVAICKAAELPFSKTLEYLLQINSDKRLNLNTNRIVNLTLRAKRGLSNTADIGAHGKDLLYFTGYTKVKRHLDSGASIQDLLYGKISFDDLKLLPQLKLTR